MGFGSMMFGLGLFGKLLRRRRGAWAWFHDVWSWSLWKPLEEEEEGCTGFGSMTFGLAVQKFLEYWMISSLKIKLNCSWKLQRNWNVPLVLLKRSWWGGFNGIYLVRFGFRMWKILIF
jgi:hypothetical protein